jgi:hypothetical protein
MTIFRSLNQFESEAFGICTSNALYLPNCVCLIGRFALDLHDWLRGVQPVGASLRLDSFVGKSPRLAAPNRGSRRPETQAAAVFDNSDLRQCRCRLLERFATDRYVELVHRFAVMSNQSLSYGGRNTSLVQKRGRSPAQTVK